MKKKILLYFLTFCMILVFTSGCAKTPNKEVLIYTDYPEYDTVDHMEDAATVIIEGKIISEKVVKLDPSETLTDEQKNDPKLNPGGETESLSFPYTIYMVEINTVYKGDVKEGNTIEIKQLGGTVDNVNYTEEDATKIQIDSTYILFLETFTNSPASLINQIQGIYEYKDNKITGNNKNKIILDLKDLR